MRNIAGKHIVLNIYTYGTLLLTMLLILLIGFWLLYPYNVKLMKNSPYKIANNYIVKRGEYIIYKIDNININRTEEVFFVNEIIFKISDTYKKDIVKCNNCRILRILVPEVLPLGTYYIHTDIYYKVNPIRTISDSYNTEYFMVVD